MKYFYMIFFLLLSNIAYSQYALEIVVPNIKKDKGVIVVGIFNNENSFLKDGEEFKIAGINIDKLTEKLTITDLPKGKYAISLFHDENSDKICNLNFLGVPKEAYGFSNNYVPFIKAPKFNKCAIDLQKDTTIIIKLIY